jgi:pimeloyl-ACP methyl ester carboxylesterase
MTFGGAAGLPLMNGAEFVPHTASVNGTTLHSMRGGEGPTVVLIHGFPQDWYEWRHVMPRLARRFSVVAVDLRGVGGSAAPATGYDAACMATDVAELIDGLGVGPVHVVGHDIGGWVAYALARLRPELVRTMVIMETLLPGIEPPDAPPVEVPLWHGGFHMVPELPETLVHGREAAYFRYFFDIGTVEEYVVTDAEIEHYVTAYGDIARLHAAFEMYRAIPENAVFNNAHRTPVDVPLLLVGGAQVFGPGMPLLAKLLRADYGWADAEAVIVEGARHYLPEERPAEIAELIEQHALRGGGGSS